MSEKLIHPSKISRAIYKEIRVHLPCIANVLAHPFPLPPLMDIGRSLPAGHPGRWSNRWWWSAVVKTRWRRSGSWHQSCSETRRGSRVQVSVTHSSVSRYWGRIQQRAGSVCAPPPVLIPTHQQIKWLGLDVYNSSTSEINQWINCWHIFRFCGLSNIV